MEEKIKELRAAIEEAAAAVTDQAQLSDFWQKFLSKNGAVAGLTKSLRDVPKEDRPAVGKTINEFAEEARTTLQATPAPRPALELYPAERFEANLPKWEELVSTGQKTNAEIEAMLSTKATLTTDQLEAIRNLGTVYEDQIEPMEGAMP